MRSTKSISYRPQEVSFALLRKSSSVSRVAVAMLFLTAFAGHFGKFLPVNLPLGRVALAALLVMTWPSLVRTPPRLSAVHWILAAQAAWIGLSAVWAGSIARSASAYALLDEVVLPAALLLLAPIAFPSRAERALLVVFGASMGSYLGLVSILQTLGPSQLLFPHYMAAIVTTESRASGPFLQVGANGAAMAMCVPLSLVAAQFGDRKVRLVGTAGCVLATAGCLLTLTRSVWLGCAAGALIFFAVDRRLRRKLPALLVGSVVALIITFVAVPSIYSSVVDRFTTQRSIDDRTTTNRAAASMVEQYPIGGIGWGEFLYEVNDFVRQEDTTPLTNTTILAHNVVLSRLAETGVVGGGLLVASILFGPMAAGLRLRRQDAQVWSRAMLAILAAWLCVAMLTPMGYAFPNYLLWLVTGVVIGLDQMKNTEVESMVGDQFV